MASIQLKEIELQSPNPALYTTPFQFRLAVDVLDDLREDMEVRVVWVGSCATLAADQTLTEDLIGPLGLGTTQCTIDVPAPQWARVPESHLLGETIISVVLLFREKEFCRASYIVNVEYVDDKPQSTICPNLLVRTLSVPVCHLSQITWLH